jgi:hypothetical protein
MAYAQHEYAHDRGIRSPIVWARANYAAGKHDALVDLWVAAKQRDYDRQQQAKEDLRQREEAARQSRRSAAIEWGRCPCRKCACGHLNNQTGRTVTADGVVQKCEECGDEEYAL